MYQILGKENTSMRVLKYKVQIRLETNKILLYINQEQ